MNAIALEWFSEVLIPDKQTWVMEDCFPRSIFSSALTLFVFFPIQENFLNNYLQTSVNGLENLRPQTQIQIKVSNVKGR